MHHLDFQPHWQGLGLIQEASLWWGLQSGSTIGKNTRPKGQPPTQTDTVFQGWESLKTQMPQECEGNCQRKEECQLRRRNALHFLTYPLRDMKNVVLETQAFILSPDCILQQQNTLTSGFWFFLPQSLFPCKPIIKTQLLQRTRTMSNTQELLEPTRAEYVHLETPVFCRNTRAGSRSCL